MQNIWIKIIVSFILVFIIINIVASFYFYHLAIARNVKEFLRDDPDLEVSAEAMDVFLEGDWRTWADEQDFEWLEMKSFDGLTLKGYYLPAKKKTNKTVVFAHGYLGRGRDMALFGQYYYEELGYNIFFADARGHGASEGDYIGFGWHDRIDYIDWIKYILSQYGKDLEIVLHGLSMGAATVLMMSGEDLPAQTKAIIADSPYSTVYDLFAYQLRRMFYLPAFPLLDSTSLLTKIRANYSFKEASALKQVQQTNIPILYIHGNEDTFVPTELTHELYENTKSEAEMVLIDQAGHGEGFVIEEDLYVNHLRRFLNRYISE